jgi:hypothetical protein
VAWYLASAKGGHAALLPFAVMGLSTLISYERAKAESLGFSARGGFMERAERMVLLGVGLAFDVLVPVLWVMLVLTILTAVHRFVMVWRQASAATGAAPAPGGHGTRPDPSVPESAAAERRQRVRRPRARGLSRVPGRR